MCGLLVLAGRGIDDERRFDAALETLAPRGPDGEGRWRDADVLIGHRRLAVIDLPGGAQPMHSTDERYVLAYNGEIYNFADLRCELEGLGRRFRTHSDTEVLLAALAQWGIDALERLDGMFAFVLWDRVQRRLLAARDRVGIKPLFWSCVDGLLVCASTLAPFWKLSSVRCRLDHAALRDYFAQTFIGPDTSILADAAPLPPGTWMRWDAATGSVASGRYWDVPAPTESPMPFEELVEATDAALQESVRRQLVADVPLGVFFSGGIDSALLAWYMTRVATEPVRTFTVKFDQSARHDEAPIAREVAKVLGTEHHELAASQITEDDFRAGVAGLDQPFGDSSYLPVLKLAALARPQITVAIGGDGGDEVFGGYPRYLKDVDHYPDGPHWRLIRAAVERRLLPVSLYRSALRGEAHVTRAFSRMGHYPVGDRAIASILTPEAAATLDLPGAMSRWQQLVRRWSGRLDRDSLMRADAWYFLTLCGLFKTDRATMACGLESRVPMLGNPVLDLVLPQPASVRLAGGLKPVLRELARRHLPAAAWDRPKRGFTVPEHDYLTHRWRAYCDHLVGRCADLAPWLDHREIERRWRELIRGRTIDWPAYAVLVLLGWLETHPVEWS